MAERALDYYTQKKEPRGPGVFRLLAAIIGSILVLVVFCILIVVSVISAHSAPSSVTFHITNNSAVGIDSLVFTIPSGDVELGPLAPGQSRDVKAAAEDKFDYKYRATARGQLVTGVAANWIDDDAQGPWRQHDISIDNSPDGSIKVGYAIGH